MLTMFLSNSPEPFNVSTIDEEEYYLTPHLLNIVEIYAYCLMPNHFHVYLKELQPNGISNFIHKLCTGYTGYFNRKYQHSGTIWQGKYKNRIVGDNLYEDYLIKYIHLNPLGIIKPEYNKEYWLENIVEAYNLLRHFPYSSLIDYLGEVRPQNIIILRGQTSRPNLDVKSSPSHPPLSLHSYHPKQ